MLKQEIVHSQIGNGHSNLLLQLATRFRSERERLGLTTAAVAHYCDVSVSSVFSWEAGRARIPVQALASLWPYGFDADALVRGEERLRSIPLVAEGRAPGSTRQECAVPEHLLLRHSMDAASAFAYCNQGAAPGLASPGDILVMSITDDRHIGQLDEETVVLYRPDVSDLPEFLCPMRSAGRGKLNIGADGASATVATSSMLSNGKVVGEFRFKHGCSKSTKLGSRPHPKRLASFLDHVGAGSR